MSNLQRLEIIIITIGLGPQNRLKILPVKEGVEEMDREGRGKDQAKTTGQDPKPTKTKP